MTLRAPYNFIPLHRRVFLPAWRNTINMDIPFEDGVCGCMNVTIHAQTPIYVRNGLPKEEAEHLKKEAFEATKEENRLNEYTKFNHIGDKYFIPGSSIKGLLRSTIEILSLGKFKQIEDQSFGNRNLNDSTYRENVRGAHCGWLYKERGCYKLTDLGEPHRIEAATLDQYFPRLRFECFIKGNISGPDGKNINFKDDKDKTALRKYQLFKEKEGNTDSLKIHYSIDSLVSSRDRGNRKIVKKGKEKQGTIVFTGQQGKYNPEKERPGKHYEFIFPDLPVNPKPIDIDEATIRAFFTVHASSADFTDFRQSQLMEGKRIPVFFKQKNDNSVESIGLTYMYKYPYRYSVHAVINQMSEELLTDDMDLAECLFGKVSNEEALRGRVHVGHAFHTGTILHLPSVMPILGQPHPSYSPLYLPNGTNWDTARAVNGRKMYPTRDNPWSNNTEVVKSATIFCPIDKGAIFKGKIHFFNLKKEELGALIAAIEIMGEKDKYHAIGSGKPLGYGRVTIETSDLECMTNNNGQSLDKKGYIDLFKSTMAGFDPGWYKSLTIQEFLILASGIPDNPPNLFDYMKPS